MIIGITGRVGSGKSTAQAILTEMKDWWVADLDKIGHDLLSDEGVKSSLVLSFGDSILMTDTSISRKDLGSIVFNNRAALEKLNSIMYPKIKERVELLISENKDDGLMCGALIEEIGLSDYCDKILVIDASDEDIISRIGEKFNNISRFQKDRNGYIKGQSMVVINNFDDHLKTDMLRCFDKNGIKL
jgi:dephospho-CoA kinase